MTEPEQWVELVRTVQAVAEAGEAGERVAARAIQRAFEDQTRKLREALKPLMDWTDEAQRMIATIESVDGEVHPIISKIAALGTDLRQALKETPDAQ